MQRPAVAGLQLDVAWEDASTNLRRIREHLERRPPQPGTLVVLPELVTSGFSFACERVAQPAGDENERTLSALALRQGVWLVAGLAVSEGDQGITNQAVVFDPRGELVLRYRKRRPFTPGGEAQHYRAGSAPGMFEWQGLRVGLFICYDLRFPELFREVAARWRPELLVVIASWPETRIAHWLKLLQARAIENQAFVLGVNRVGDDPSHHHSGASILVNPWGEVLAEAGQGEGWVTGDLDPEALRGYRAKLPFLDDLLPC